MTRLGKGRDVAMRLRRLVIAAAVGAVWAIQGTATFAAGTGTAGMSVTSSSPCVTVSGSFDYGTLPFSGQASSMSSQKTGPTITNCSGTSEFLSAHASNLENGNIVWTPTSTAPSLLDPCPTLNQFVVLSGQIPDTGPGPLNTVIGSTDVSVGVLYSETPADWRTVLVMPCAGSAGFGLQMSGQLTVTASF
jgi:hypothetical protein